MLYLAIVFLVVAVISGILGFTAIVGVSLWIAKWLFIIFLILFIVSLVFYRRRRVRV